MEKIINKIESAVKNELSKVEKTIFRLYFTNKNTQTTEEIGKNEKLPHKISKQRVSFIIKDLVKKIPESNPELLKMLDEKFLSDDYIYFDSSHFGQYATFFGKLVKDRYGFHSIGIGLFTSDDRFKYYTQQKYLSSMIKKEGLPLTFADFGDGFGDIVWFGMKASQEDDEWLTIGNTLVGSNKFTFCTNCCRYQIKEPISIWDIYTEYMEHFRDYLKKYEVDTPKELCLFIQRRMKNLSKAEGGCDIKIIFQAKETPLKFPIYEMSGIDTPSDKTLEKVTQINEFL